MTATLPTFLVAKAVVNRKQASGWRGDVTLLLVRELGVTFAQARSWANTLSVYVPDEEEWA